MNSKRCLCGLRRKCPVYEKENELEKKLASSNIKKMYDSVIPTIKIIPFEELITYLKLKDFPSREDADIDSKSGARIKTVIPYELPSGPGYRVLGMYDPSTHTIYIANDLSQKDRDFVYHHEVAH